LNAPRLTIDDLGFLIAVPSAELGDALVAFVNGSLILVAQAFFGALDALVLTYTFFVNGLICAVLDLLFFFVEALFLCLCPGVMLLSGLFNVGFLCFLFFCFDL
jgi:hypothetical protein